MIKTFIYFLVILGLLITPLTTQAQVLINEVLASNGAGIPDEDGDTVPWIELYNSGDDSINLEDYGLSDDYDRPFRWEFPDIVIEPGEFLLIFASGKDRDDPDGELHSNFRVSVAGEEVLITDPDGDRVDEMEPTPMETDVSFGRQPDGADDWYFFNEPTPGESNTTEGYQDLLPPPEFSHDGGFYPSPFDLSVDHTDTDITIRYTLDGSEPDEDDPILDGEIEITDRSDDPNLISTIQTTPDEGEDRGYGWNEPENPVFKGTVIRARAFRDGYKPSNTITRSFFVDEEAGDRYDLPVVSLVTDSLHLFDHEDGIYIPGKIYEENGFGSGNWGSNANYRERGIEWERPASFELFDKAGVAEHVQDIGIRIHGGGSRSLPLKSFRLYARNDYGENRFYHQIFPDQPDDEYNRLILRNSGQDFYNSATMFRDAFLQELFTDMNFDKQAYRPSIVFVNGEYWGIMNFRERYDEDYIARTYGVPDDQIDLLNNNGIIDEGSDQRYNELMDFVESHDISEAEHYETLSTMMDTDNYMDYLLAQVFIRNTDWPANNTDLWRLQTDFEEDVPKGHDGRFRWMMFDTDFGFGLNSRDGTYDFDMIDHITAEDSDHWSNPPWSTLLARNLLSNESFRQQFLTRYATYLNTRFDPDHVHAVLEEFESNIGQVISEHIDRWGHPRSEEHWQNNVNDMYEFAEKRPSYTRSHIKNHFDIDDEVDLELDVSGNSTGYIKIDSVAIKSSSKGVDLDTYPWTGTYFSGVPMELEAISLPGYEFDHWLVNDEKETSAELRLSMDEDTRVEAVFAEEDDQPFPDAFEVASGSYHFSEWRSDEEPGSFPDHMAFVYMDEPEPTEEAEVDGFINGAYNLDSRTRIMGLGDGGFAFINTSNLDGNPGYPGRRLGGAILALDTRDVDELYTEFTAGTVLPNSRVYNLKLQYRIGDEGSFETLLDDEGRPVEYHRDEVAGHTRDFGPIELPDEIMNQPYVQLLWRYYYTGVRLDDDSGQRSKMNISEIKISDDVFSNTDEDTTDPEIPDEVTLEQNAPNPFNSSTNITFSLPEVMHAKLSVYSVTGEQVATLINGQLNAGTHTESFDASSLASGVYIYRLITDQTSKSKKMLLVE